nr:MAG TPA: hypothetical protein [Caudoviricetes sp.]
MWPFLLLCVETLYTRAFRAYRGFIRAQNRIVWEWY